VSDISNLLTENPQPEPQNPRNQPPATVPEPTEEQMTPVQKIRAYKDGNLKFPDIVPTTDETEYPDTDPDSDTAEESPPPEDQADQSVKAEFSPKDLLQKLQKPAIIVGALLTVGGGLYLSGATTKKSDDKSTPPAAYTPSTTPTTTTKTGPNPESLIKPISAEFTPSDVCGLGSTPAMDAFTGQKNTAAVCENQLGIVPGTAVTITLPSLSRIEEIWTIAGFPGKDPEKKDNWTKYPLLSSILWYFDNTQPQPQHFTTDRKSQPLKLDHPVYTKTIRMVILETTQAPKTESASTTTPSDGLFGDLGDWGKNLGGGKPSSTPGSSSTTPTNGAPAPAVTAFAIGPIRIIGRPAD
jgi:hypothetical protein